MAFTSFAIQAISLLLSVFCSEAFAAGPQVVQTNEPLVIDGHLNESQWHCTPITDDFIRYIPTDGGPPPGKTKVRFLQDDEFLYIGVVVSEINYDLQARISPREQINDDDQIGVYIDPIGDGRSGYIFYFNPFGIQQDVRYANGNWYSQWNMVIHSEGRVTEDGYVLEIALPFKFLFYTEDSDWNIILTRKIPAIGAKYSHPMIQRNHPRIFTQAIPLEGLKPPPSGLGLQLQPTASGFLVHQEEENQLELLPITKDSARLSLDLRWSPSSNTRMTGTFYPDFSQIEADVRQLNLNQRFAFYYPERRPFFLDNLEQFSDRASTLYSRSIMDPLYGIKLSGRSGKLNYGVLHALDQTPASSIHEYGTEGFSPEDVNNAVAENLYLRLRQDAFGAGYIGLYAADKRTFLKDQSTGKEAFNNILGGDIQIPFGETFTLNSHIASSIAGPKDEDPMIGSSGSFGIGRSAPKGFGGNLSASYSSEDYRQEMGFLTTSGRQNYSGELNHTTINKNDHLIKPTINTSYTSELSGNYNARIGFSQSYRIPSVIRVKGYFTPTWIRYQDTNLQGYSTGGEVNIRFNKELKLNFEINNGKELSYSLLIPAQTTSISSGVIIRPTQAIWIDLTVFEQWLTPQNNSLERASSYYSKVNWQFTKTLGLRAIQQTTFSDGTPSTFANVLLTWMKHPGTEAYLGASWNLSENNEKISLDEQQIFLKYTHLFSL